MTERTTMNITASIENLDSVLEFVDARLEEEIVH